MASDKPLDNVILSRMRNFSNMNKLKREALKFIATKLSPDEIEGLKQVFKVGGCCDCHAAPTTAHCSTCFMKTSCVHMDNQYDVLHCDEPQSLDIDGDGAITVEEMRSGMKRLGSTLNQEELDQMIKDMDVDGSGTIDYEEFITATLNLATLEKEELLKKAFEHFDADGSGYITMDELEAALKELGMDDIKDILEKVDTDGDGKIDYDEFVNMMVSNNETTFRAQSGADRGTNMRKAAKSAM